jgi:hypothetical protein
MREAPAVLGWRASGVVAAAAALMAVAPARAEGPIASPADAAVTVASSGDAGASSAGGSEPAASSRPPFRSLRERLWYREPAARQSDMSQQIVDQLTELGNQLGYHLDLLSLDLIALRVDGRRRRVHLGVAAGERGFLSFQLGGDFHFVDGLARVTTRIDLAIAGHTLELELPEVELAPASYRGERGVEVRLPIVNRRF